jgi:hypothetical protein
MAAMALSWLVLIICFLTHIQAQRLEYMKEQIPIIEDSIKPLRVPELPDYLQWTGIFPAKLLRLPCVRPPDESKLEEIRNWYGNSTDELEYAKGELEKPDDTPPEIDWKVSLYQLIIAYIVNLRDDTVDIGEETSEQWIKPAAAIFGLEYIFFTDFAKLTAPYLHSGPYCGVFVSKGPKPFMILSFKGTTYAEEGATNLHVIPTTQINNNLYNQPVHQGMYRGLFGQFIGPSDSAINVIWTKLEDVAKNELGGSEGNPVPLYVSGHSLGAGYAQLVYVELFRRLALETPKAYQLKSLYAFAAPRVGAILGTGFASKVNEVFEGSRKPIFRYSNEYDVVPFSPGIVTRNMTGHNIVTSGWIHLDGGYILRRHLSRAPYWKSDTSEIGQLPKADEDGRTSWEHHFPAEYYYAIKKITDPKFVDPGPPAELDYDRDEDGKCLNEED